LIDVLCLNVFINFFLQPVAEVPFRINMENDDISRDALKSLIFEETLKFKERQPDNAP